MISSGGQQSDVFRFADEIGPKKIVAIYDPSCGLKAILVVDNVAAGPSIGGTRMAPDVSLEECFRLARAMTMKNAAASLPHGGGKSVIFADPDMEPHAKETLIRAFARAVGEITDYIPGPDMGTNETAMAWVHDEIGRAVGLPREIGGIPLDEIGATGFGLAIAAEAAQDHAGISLKGARIAVQGYGAVGRHAARSLAERGAVLVGVSDSQGTLIGKDGLDHTALEALKAEGRSVTDAPFGTTADRDAIIGVDCDILIPAARPDVLSSDNVDLLKTRLVLQGANIPATEEAEIQLHQRGVVSVPDFIANAGGVICAAVEYHGGTQSQAFSAIEDKVRDNTRTVLERARQNKIRPREAAVALARERVLSVQKLRRFA
ncbi:MAG: Glu/Leu/Phe/Val dehydrogenase [Rhizobiales bacterium]|nr:Glu/Leu/Phe/Val dehydrogenase [Hyphomicrobiales bacterium]